MEAIFLIFLFLIGACCGSFLCCQARRLRLKSHPPKSSKKFHHRTLGSRSICLHCHRQLKWHDNLPIISWIILRGKCRKCHKKIGLAELLSELGVSIAFLLIGTTINFCSTPLEWAIFLTVLFLTLNLAFLAIYDGLYGELPTPCLIISIITAIIILALREWSFLAVSPFSMELIWQPFLAILILGGLYLSLYMVSKGKWVGDGDWLLATAISATLFYPWLSLITLFLANFFACLVMYPQAKGKSSRKIHLGPFLVSAFIITYSFSNFFIFMVQ